MSARRQPLLLHTRWAVAVFITAVMPWNTVETGGAAVTEPLTRLIVLAKLLSMRKTMVNGRFPRGAVRVVYSYTASILFSTGPSGVNRRIGPMTIVTRRAPERTMSIDLPYSKPPLMLPHQVVLIAVSATRTRQRFELEYLGPVGVGVFGACAVPPMEVKRLIAALQRYEKWHSATWPVNSAKRLGHAWALTKSRNYFLWALGVDQISRYGPRRDILRLANTLSDCKLPSPQLASKLGLRFPHLFLGSNLTVLSLRRATWLFCCLTRVVPGGKRPNVEKSCALFLDFLRAYEAINKNRFLPEWSIASSLPGVSTSKSKPPAPPAGK